MTEKTELRRIMIALPCASGSHPSALTESLINETVFAATEGIILYPYFLNGCSRVEEARNVLVSQFYASPHFTELVFVDTDQAFGLGDLIKLLKYPVDIVGGVARIKREPEEYKLNWKREDVKDGEFTVTKDANGLIEVDSIGACFMRISRNAITTLIADNPELEYKQSGTTLGMCWGLFWPQLNDKQSFGEDMSFCQLAKKSGFKIYLDPEIYLAHIGSHYYEGSLAMHLKRQMEAGKDSGD